MSSKDVALNRAVRGNKMNGRNQILDVPRVGVFCAGGQTIATGTATAITWDTVMYDVEGMWRSASPTRLTAITAGVFAFEAFGWFSLAAGGFREMYLRTNGTGVTNEDTRAPTTTVTSVGSRAHIALNAGDYVEAIVSQNSGGPVGFPGATLANLVNGFQACMISTF